MQIELTPRQIATLKRIAMGDSVKIAAEMMQCSPEAIQRDIGNIMTALGNRSRMALTHYALHTGLVRNMFEKGKK